MTDIKNTEKIKPRCGKLITEGASMRLDHRNCGLEAGHEQVTGSPCIDTAQYSMFDLPLRW